MHCLGAVCRFNTCTPQRLCNLQAVRLCTGGYSEFWPAAPPLTRYHGMSQEWWEQNDEKPTTIALGLAGFVALWATSGLLDSINKLPLIGGVFEVRLLPACVANLFPVT